MRLVVDDYNATDMKRLSDFDRILNLLGELNTDFPYCAMIQLKKNMDYDVVLTVDSTVSLHGDRLGFEEKTNNLWKMCFGSESPIRFDYGTGYHSSIRQIANGC